MRVETLFALRQPGYGVDVAVSADDDKSMAERSITLKDEVVGMTSFKFFYRNLMSL